MQTRRHHLQQLLGTAALGTQILTHAEPKSVHPARGHIGLQIHGGPAGAGGVVRYRNIRIKRL